MNYLLTALSVLSVVGSAAAILYYRHRTRRTMETMNAMLNEAIAGCFSESHFDESLLSSVEMKLAQYLSHSNVSTQNLAAEKDKIKELISDISHQTKTPVANILLYAQLLGEESLPQKSMDCVKALNEQAEKLNFLIQSLVKTSRLETGIIALSPAAGQLKPMLEQVINQAMPKADQKGVTLTSGFIDITAVFDSKWTSEAVSNILDNAIKYTPAGGSIHIQAASYEIFCRIDITDTGIGIAEVEQPKIFKRFYRSPAVQNAEGVGIGLYLARQIIAGEGGYIKVFSAPGEGSTFSIFLPRQA